MGSLCSVSLCLGCCAKVMPVSADPDFDGVLMAIVEEGNCLPGYCLPVNREQIFAGRISGEADDGDVIDRLPVAVVDLETCPSLRHAGGQAQLSALQVRAQQGFDQQPVHPAGGTRVPGPTAPAQ